MLAHEYSLFNYHLYTSFMLYELLNYMLQVVDKLNKIHLVLKTLKLPNS